MRPYLCIAGIVVAAGGLLASAAASFDNVTENAIVAQQRMRAIATGLQIYQNENEGCSLDDPVRLFTTGCVMDPLLFWHPGDSNPPPTTIDNSVIDAPNSAQISFTITDTLGDCLPPGSTLIQDNSPANNDGRFVQYLTNDGYMLTDPPGAMPVPTNVAVTRHALGMLYGVCKEYAGGNQWMFVPHLSQRHADGYLSVHSFWNPGDSDPLPATIDNDVPNAMNSALISFDYFVAGQICRDVPPDTIVLADNSPANNGGYGINVVRANGRIEFLPVDPMGDADRDGDVDLADWARFQVCSTLGSSYGILDNACRVLDWDGNNQIGWDDHNEFVSAMTGPQR